MKVSLLGFADLEERRATRVKRARLAGLAQGMSLCVALCLGGCGTTNSGGTLDTALSAVGLQRPALLTDENVAAAQRAAASRPTRLTLRIHAGEHLNIDSSGQSLPLVTRIYKLRDKQAFQQTPDTAFVDAGGGVVPTFNADIVEVKEVILTPGLRHEVVEVMPPEAPYLAVVALFRAPADKRSRFVFNVKESAQAGITVGLHACAMSVASGVALDVPPERLQLAGVKC